MRCFLLGVPQHHNNSDFFKYNVRHITIKKNPPVTLSSKHDWDRVECLKEIEYNWLYMITWFKSKYPAPFETAYTYWVGWHGMHPYWNSKMIALTLTAKQKCTKIITNHKAHCCFHLCPQEVRNMHLIPILHNLYLFILSDNPTTCPTQWLCESFLQPLVKLSTGTYSLAYFDLKKIWSHPLLASGSVTSHHQLLFW